MRWEANYIFDCRWNINMKLYIQNNDVITLDTVYITRSADESTLLGIPSQKYSCCIYIYCFCQPHYKVCKEILCRISFIFIGCSMSHYKQRVWVQVTIWGLFITFIVLYFYMTYTLPYRERIQHRYDFLGSP